MNKEFLDYIYSALELICDPLLTDSSRTSAAFHLGRLMEFIRIHIENLEEDIK